CYRRFRVLPSFPTRRSSDLFGLLLLTGFVLWWPGTSRWTTGFGPGWPSLTRAFLWRLHGVVGLYSLWLLAIWAVTAFYFAFPARSEEHTSELQSRENLVCRL